MTNATYKDFTEYHASQIIWKIAPPILIAIGTIGNMLSFVVLARKSMRKSNISIYLSFLACCDTAVLYTGLLRRWVRITWSIDVRTFSFASCKIHVFMTYLSLDLSVWTIVGVTVERALAIWFPQGVKCFQSSRVKKLILVLTIVIALCGLNAHLLYGYSIKEGAAAYCSILSSDYKIFAYNIWPWLDLCVYCFAPFCIIILANGLIVVKLYRNKKSMKTFMVAESASSREADRKRSARASSVTTMLFVVNTVFIVTTSPITIYLIGSNHWITVDPHEEAKQELAWACVNILQYTNNSVNFFIYCLSGSKFREELLSMIRCRKVNNSLPIPTDVQKQTSSKTSVSAIELNPVP